jgi:hypothetical protein
MNLKPKKTSARSAAKAHQLVIGQYMYINVRPLIIGCQESRKKLLSAWVASGFLNTFSGS